ncbi:MAG: hypothetical protein FJ115_06295 [Deltaproteobacteria bacterium]|nr:hypothetical protein [Deltaproteobacteria bacterium]
MDPREFHILASELVSRNRAADLRTAISRAYYAVFNLGVGILVELGFQVREGTGGHGDVRHRLSNSGDSELVKVGSQLGELQSRRIQADYRLTQKDIENQKMAEALVQLAGKMIRTLDECRSGPRRLEIIKAIQDWEIKTGQHP